MAELLSDFLQTDDLDAAQRLYGVICSTNHVDLPSIPSIIQSWDEPQAVANLLMFPALLPADLRSDALMRGLNEPLTYNTLASIIGLQGHADWWSDIERATIVERLQFIAFGAPHVLANRASITLLDYVRPQDADKLVFSLGSPNEVVQHNSLLALLRLFGKEETRRRVNETFIARRVTVTGQDYVANHLDTLEADDLLLLTYIPNLKDFAA